MDIDIQVDVYNVSTQLAYFESIIFLNFLGSIQELSNGVMQLK